MQDDANLAYNPVDQKIKKIREALMHVPVT